MVFLQEYTMLDELGKGGFATVYKVRHNELGYIRAMRVLNETIAVKRGQAPEENDTYKKFKRECVTLLRLGNGNHPNIVHIYQPRLLENKALVEMDYVDGMDISKYLNKEYGFVPVEDVIRMATQMSSALAYCHEDIYRFCMDRDLDNLEDDPDDGSKVLLDESTRERLITKYKVIHNDIHSGNIMRREDGNFVLLDFGLAINGDEIVRSSRHTNGAPEFKAPEKWDDESILTEQSDIYSFGIVLFQYLTGRVPFLYNRQISNYKAEFELGEAHQKAPLPSIEVLRKESFEQKYEGKEYKKDYPQWLEDAIIKCLQKRPEDRFRNGKELNNFIIEHSKEMVKVPEELLKEIEMLNKKNDELSSEVTNLEGINIKMSLEIENLKDLLARTHESLEDVNRQKDSLQTQLTKKGWMIKILVSVLILCGGLLYYITSYNKTAPIESPNEEALAQKDLQIQEKDSVIKRLEECVGAGQTNSSEITKLNKIIEEKELIIIKKNNEIEAMKNDAVSSKNISADIVKLKASIAEKEKQINKLQISLKNEQNEVKNLKAQLVNAKTNNSGNSSEITNLKNIIIQKDNAISALNAKLITANNNIATLQKQLDKANKEIETIKKYM